MSQILESARTVLTGLWADAVWGEWEPEVPDLSTPLPACPAGAPPRADADRAAPLADTRH